MPQSLPETTELEGLRRAIIQLNCENAILRDMLAVAIEVADLAIHSALEHTKARQSDLGVNNHSSKLCRQRYLQ